MDATKNAEHGEEDPSFFPYNSNILCADRHLLNGHRSALVWFTGLSGSGKSTVAHALGKLYKVPSSTMRHIMKGPPVRENPDLTIAWPSSAPPRSDKDRSAQSFAKAEIFV